jgi:hypothetical protein
MPITPHEQAANWVADQLVHLRSLPYERLREIEGKPTHEELQSANGDLAIGETQVTFDADGTTLRIEVDVWRPKRLGVIIGSLAAGGFTISPDGAVSDDE